MIWAATAVVSSVVMLALTMPGDKPARRGAKAQPSCDSEQILDTVNKKADAAVPGQLNFQTPATAIMEKIVDLHHDLMFFIILIVVFVS